MNGILNNVLVATDGTVDGDRAVTFAIALARRQATTLTFCYAVDTARALAECAAASGGLDFLSLEQELRAAAKVVVDDAVKLAAEAGLSATATVIVGSAAEAIVNYADEYRVDAIVMGTQGKHGLERFFMGSTAANVLRQSSIPVFVVPPGVSETDLALDSMLVAVDESDPSDAAADYALALAQALAARVAFCCVAETEVVLENVASYGYDPAALVEELQAAAATQLAVQVRRVKNVSAIAIESVVAKGNPADEILSTAAAQNARLIVVGTHGRRGLRRLFVGSVAESVVSRSSVPVLVVRASSASAGGVTRQVLATSAI